MEDSVKKEKFNLRAALLFWTTDLKARVKVNKCLNPGALCGCPYCNMVGVHVSMLKKTIYPSKPGGGQYDVRTNDDYIRLTKEATKVKVGFSLELVCWIDRSSILFSTAIHNTH